jgi:DnaT-like ssDNA binding protein
VSITLDATPGSATGNSFASALQAIARAATRSNLVGWTTVSGTTLTESEKTWLIEATRDLSYLEPQYQGYRTDAIQVLAFPRRLVINTKAPWLATVGLTGYPEYPDTVYPDDLVAATIELAFEYAKAGTTDLAALDDTAAITKEVVGPIETDYAEPYNRPTGIARFPRVMQLIAPLFDAAYTGGLTLVRT